MNVTQEEAQAMSPAELSESFGIISAEMRQRKTAEEIPKRMDKLNREYLAATGRVMGAEWDEPSGAHDAYPKGWTATREGALYRSKVNANTAMPGDPDDPQSYRWWEEVAPEGGSGDGEWDPNGHAYAVGDPLTYEGEPYEVRQAHTSQPDWTPDVVTSLYTKL